MAQNPKASQITHGGNGDRRKKGKSISKSYAPNLEEVIERMDRSMAACHEDVTTLEGKVDDLEKYVKVLPNQEEVHGLVNALATKLRQEMMETSQKFMEEMMVRMNQLIAENVVLKDRLSNVESDCARCKEVIASGVGSSRGFMPMLDTPRPHKFKGVRNAKEIDNFLYGVERYFAATHLLDDSLRIIHATLYLEEDAMLWWRARHREIERGICVMNTWEDFKAELKKYFYPANAELDAVRRLRNLKHTGTVKEYIMDYSSLMLEIADMREKDRLFYFLDGLQSWAEKELRRRNVQDLSTVYREAESLIEYSFEKKDNGRKENVNKGGGGKFQKSGQNSYESKGKNKEYGSEDSFKSLHSCFICGGNHFMCDCPQKKVLSAMIARQAEKVNTSDAQMGSLTPLNSNSKLKEQAISLMYVEVRVKGVICKALVDTGVSHNFLSPKEAQRMELRITKEAGRMKAVNSNTRPILGVTYGVPITLGSWQGRVNFTVTEIDDYDMVLGMEFVDVAAPVTFSGDNTMHLGKGKQCHVVLLARAKV